MLVIERIRHTVRICEIWFPDDVLSELKKTRDSCDILFFRQSKTSHGKNAREFTTSIVPLSPDEQDIFAGFRKNVRYEIRRAEKSDDLVCSFADVTSPNSLDEFRLFYDKFATAKGLPLSHKKFLEAALKSASLTITVAASEGEMLVAHAYLHNDKRARLLHSCSLFRESDDGERRNLIGRANRYLHWWDMRKFKEKGFHEYDLGGYYIGSDDPEKTRIREFKAGFGGTLCTEYYFALGLTLKGKLALRWLMKQ